MAAIPAKSSRVPTAIYTGSPPTPPSTVFKVTPAGVRNTVYRFEGNNGSGPSRLIAEHGRKCLRHDPGRRNPSSRKHLQNRSSRAGDHLLLRRRRRPAASGPVIRRRRAQSLWRGRPRRRVQSGNHLQAEQGSSAKPPQHLDPIAGPHRREGVDRRIYRHGQRSQEGHHSRNRSFAQWGWTSPSRIRCSSCTKGAPPSRSTMIGEKTRRSRGDRDSAHE